MGWRWGSGAGVGGGVGQEIWTLEGAGVGGGFYQFRQLSVHLISGTWGWGPQLGYGGELHDFCVLPWQA